MSAVLFTLSLSSYAEKLSLKTEKGFELKVSYYQSSVKSQRAVLMLHQCNYNRTMYNDIGQQ